MSGQKTQAEVVAEMQALRSAWAEAVKSAPWQDVEALLQAGNALDAFVARLLAAAPEAEQIARDAEQYRALPSTSPSTAAGERARQYLAIARGHAGHIEVEEPGPNGEAPCTIADLIDSALIDAALATPPAQSTTNVSRRGAE
ncbi:MAG: hypothetical protein E7K72_11850 [Roseomonas mucosa]|nr:hypothetical protein [Roseomonas mucosa]